MRTISQEHCKTPLGLVSCCIAANIRKERHSAINALLSALAIVSPSTLEHSLRVAANCIELADQCIRLLHGYLDLDELFASALLHDIGKITVHPDILNCSGELSVGEMAQMREHARMGETILSAVPELKDIASIVASHHERWDGGGYPRGLIALNAPSAARIIAVCDTFDAIVSHRTYRCARSIEEARAIILEQATRQFDPTCVGLFLNIPKTRLIVPQESTL